MRTRTNLIAATVLLLASTLLGACAEDTAAQAPEPAAEQPANEQPVIDTATLEQNKALVVRVYEEAYNQGNLATIDELLAPDYINHQVFPGLPNDREGLKMVIQSMRTGFPDLDIVIHDIIAEDDIVYVRATITGTHQGELMGIPGSGNPVAFDTIDAFRLKDGKQIEHWGVTDQLSLMYQIGALPSGM